MTAMRVGSFCFPSSPLLSKEYKGIAGLPDKHNLLKNNSLKFIWQFRIWPIWQLCRFPPKANPTNYIKGPRTFFPAIPSVWVAGFIRHFKKRRRISNMNTEMSNEGFGGHPT